jgi:hypothetical protein
MNPLPNQGASESADCRYFGDASIDGQRARLLDVLRVTPVTSFEACDDLEVTEPHKHVEALRAGGYNIQASFLWMVYPDGQRRYATRYELQSGAYRPWVAIDRTPTASFNMRRRYSKVTTSLHSEAL